ncbi:hypothetical protein AAG570_004421 [Ranatra chinensis]|uniref:Ig-like domain-containing protein n=1 Tax=Ranatra chinensis TaxID=642074 RepID=A0ABD0YDF4_9HEMI
MDTREEVVVVEERVVQETVRPLPPRFVERIQPIISEVERPVLFKCKVQGSPFPKIVWYRNGKEVRATENVEMVVVEDVATLEIRKVTKEDVGVFSCKASNPAGVATCTANLVVIGIVTEFDLQAVSAGSNLYFEKFCLSNDF